MNFDQLPNPFVIAEIGGNHEGDFEYACRLLEAAAGAGAHAVKFQAYRPDGIVNPMVDPQRHRHFGRFALPPADYVKLAQRCESLGVQFMASVWDAEYLALLDPFIAIHKVGSGDLTNRPLIRRLLQTAKPLCVATAMATLQEVLDFVAFVDHVVPGFRRAGRLCLMHCVALYGDPRDEFANLKAIETLRRSLPPEVAVGYSDHTVGSIAMEIAVSLGATVLEKHFTDDTTRSFRDHHISITETGLRAFKEFLRRRQVLLGDGRKQPVVDVETPARIREFRRGVFFSRDMQSGEIASEDVLITLRPCEGICATDYDHVMGRRLRVARRALEPLQWEDFEGGPSGR